MKETHATTITERKNGVKTTCPSKYINGNLHLRRLTRGERKWLPKEDVEDIYQIGNTVFYQSDIALVPSEGYVTDCFSKASIQWLEWLTQMHRQEGRALDITHGMNGQEHREGPYRLDGFHASTRTAYEFLGKF